MKRKLSPAKRSWYLLLLPLLIVVSLLVLVWSPRGLLDLRQLQLEYQQLIEKNRTLEEENHLLYEEIDRLANDPSALENLARQELGLVREDELIFQFLPPTEADKH
ncbi:MAG: septum formation initiator family protein [Deltaproteobacteria bacterium]|nr:MAG: septum formation initiator family protein [Deltaproteobacteria bacterium]